MNTIRLKVLDLMLLIHVELDHTPRSGAKGYLYHNSTPELFKNHVEDVFKHISHKKQKIVFLKSWNEWGEGNYIEPDLVHGKGYIQALNNVVSKYIKGKI